MDVSYNFSSLVAEDESSDNSSETATSGDQSVQGSFLNLLPPQLEVSHIQTGSLSPKHP